MRDGCVGLTKIDFWIPEEKMNTLNFDCVVLISLQSPGAWFALVRVYRGLAKMAESEEFREMLAERFVRKNSFGEWVLPDGRYHSKGGLPSTESEARGEWYWHKWGDFHRGGDLPAVVFRNGSKCWCWRGKLDRAYGLPAMIENRSCVNCDYGSWENVVGFSDFPLGVRVLWYREGELSRDDDQPAMVKTSLVIGGVVVDEGVRRWYIRGLLDRANGLPAEITDAGQQTWYKAGVIHRGDGLPAIVRADGTMEWYVDGCKVEM